MEPSESKGTVTATLLLGGEARTLRPGLVVLVRKGTNDCYGAVIESVDDLWINLTFTPHGEARRVPAGAIISTVSQRSTTATLEMPLIPQYQPLTTVAPRRREGEG